MRDLTAAISGGIVYVGSYAPEAAAGIHRLSFEAEHGTLSRAGSVSGIANPSFLTLDQERTVLFAASEGKEGVAVSYAIDLRDGSLTEVGRQSTLSASPCHLALDQTGRWLAVAHYAGGHISLLPVSGAGGIGPVADAVQHRGSGADPQRQEAPHPHSVNPVPQGDGFLVADLGTDTVYAYRIQEGKWVESARSRTDPGTGPRHLAFHPGLPVVYVSGELDSTVHVFAHDRATGALEKRQALSTLPAGVRLRNTGAHIEIDLSGRFLYASNRGHDSIATFAIGEDGFLTYVAATSTGGKTPRHFCLVSGTPYLLVANQDSDGVAVMRIGEDGVPHSTGHVCRVERPVCVIVLR